MLNSVPSFQKILLLLLTAFLTVIHLSISAQPFFTKAIGMESFEKGSAIKLLPGGGFIIAGETENPTAQERDMLLMQTDSNGNLLWIKTFGGPERETVNDVLQTPADRGFIMLGEKYQPNKQEGENLTLVKTDKDGDLKWKKIFDEGGNETEGFSMQPTPDHGYVITGMVKNMSLVSSAFFSMSAEDQGLYLLKIDGNGNKIWSRRFNYGSGNVSSTGTSVIVASDGSYMVAGNIAKKGRTDKKIERPAQQVDMKDVRDMLLCKVKPNGSLLWAKEYEANSITMGYTVTEKTEGGYMVAGNTNVSATNIDIFLMSLDVNGNVQWSKTFGGPRFESVSDVAQAPDGGFIISGMTYSTPSGVSDVLSFKTDKQGNLQWSKTYGGQNEDYPAKLLLTNTGIVTVGATASNGSESFDILLMKSDWNGNCGSFGKDAKLSVSNFNPIASKIEKPEMGKVEQGVFPPNMKKPDAENIIEHKREARVKNLGD
jgi:hypothetical protein